ncbi:MAG TPA: type II toxin-antitoxin system RelE/ParE family toxin [Candidatus Saccharimonadales bacterium]
MKVVFLPAAEHDLGGLFAYISEKLQNSIAAHNIVEKILRLAYKLASFPEMGASLKTIDTRIGSYRYLLVDNYLIIYKVEAQEVNVVRILYARSDYVRLLQD